MPDLSLPEIHLPDIKLPDGLRDMNRHDIQSALNDRMPKRIEMPDVDLSKVELPKVVEERLDRIEKAIGRMDLPKAVADRLALQDRLPRRKRSNPFLPLAALAAVGSMFVAAWWLITSPTAGTRLRWTADRIKARITGAETAVERYDDDSDLGSLLPKPDLTRPSVENEAWPDSYAEVGEAVSAGNGSGAEPVMGA